MGAFSGGRGRAWPSSRQPLRMCCIAQVPVVLGREPAQGLRSIIPGPHMASPVLESAFDKTACDRVSVVPFLWRGGSTACFVIVVVGFRRCPDRNHYRTSQTRNSCMSSKCTNGCVQLRLRKLMTREKPSAGKTQVLTPGVSKSFTTLAKKYQIYAKQRPVLAAPTICPASD